MIIGNGYTKNHAQITLDVLRENPKPVSYTHLDVYKRQVQARGAKVLALTTEAGAEALHKRVDTVWTVPEAEAMLLPQLGVTPLQLLSYYTALERGCDIDKPRNLAKSVTVE